MTRRTGNLELIDRDWLEIHPDDAARARGSPTATWSRCAAASGEIEIEAQRDRADRAGPRLHRVPLPRGADEPAGRLVAPTSTPRCPEYKVDRGRRAAGRRGAVAHAGARRAGGLSAAMDDAGAGAA